MPITGRQLDFNIVRIRLSLFLRKESNGTLELSFDYAIAYYVQVCCRSGTFAGSFAHFRGFITNAVENTPQAVYKSSYD